MNKVVLRINPDTNLNTISINGKPLSLYSELNNFMREPFASWIEKFFDCLERELNDDFSLTVISKEDDARLLKELSSKCDSCLEFIHEAFGKTIKVSLEAFPERIELGEKQQLHFVTEENGAKLPEIRAFVMNDKVIECDGKYLYPVSTGETDIEFFKGEELIPFEKKHVEVFQNHFIQKIELRVEKQTLGVNMEEALEIKIYPPDAEDTADLKCIISNIDVATVTPEGKIRTHNVGETTITVKSKETQCSLNICVLPDIEKIVLDREELCFFVGEKADISVSVEPEDAFDKAYYWKTTDNSVAVVKTDDEGRTYIHATGIGSCKIICHARKGLASREIPISVGSTLNRKDLRKGWLRNTGILFVVLAIAVLYVPSPVFIGCSAVAFYLCGFATLFKEKRSAVWALVMMAIPIVIYIMEYLDI